MVQARLCETVHAIDEMLALLAQRFAVIDGRQSGAGHAGHHFRLVGRTASLVELRAQRPCAFEVVAADDVSCPDRSQAAHIFRRAPLGGQVTPNLRLVRVVTQQVSRRPWAVGEPILWQVFMSGSRRRTSGRRLPLRAWP